jgi:hypothetical protein
VFNLKWCGIGALLGFILSLLVGLFSGAGFPVAVMRAFIMGAAFFILAGGMWFVISHFLPELLNTEDEAGSLGDVSPGSRVDITLGDEGGERFQGALPGQGTEEDLENIAVLMEGRHASQSAPPQGGEASPGDFGVSAASAMDQMGEDKYTKKGSDPNNGSNAGFSGGAGSASSGGLDTLPDLDAIAGSFSSPAEEPVETAAPVPGPSRSPAGGKAQSMNGDFNPKDLAMGIRTILNKEG